MKNVLKPLAKSILIQLGLAASASATNAAIKKKVFGSGITTFIISNERMDDTLKIIKYLKESGLLVKGASESVKNEAKEEKSEFFSMLLGTLAASLLGNLLTRKGVKAKILGKGVIRASEGTTRAGQDF